MQQSVQNVGFSIQSSELGPPTLKQQAPAVLLPSPLLDPRGETNSLAGGGREPNSDDGTDILILYVYYNPSTFIPFSSFILFLIFCALISLQVYFSLLIFSLPFSLFLFSFSCVFFLLRPFYFPNFNFMVHFFSCSISLTFCWSRYLSPFSFFGSTVSINKICWVSFPFVWQVWCQRQEVPVVLQPEGEDQNGFFQQSKQGMENASNICLPAPHDC